MANVNGRSRVMVAVLLASTLLGCGPQFDPASKLQSLRVLAIKKDDPYARISATTTTDVTDDSYRPDNVINLTVALEDSRPKSERLGSLQTLWFSGCSNPYSDNYFACLPWIWLTFKAYEYFEPVLDDAHPSWGLSDIDVADALQFVSDTFPAYSEQYSSGTSGLSDEQKSQLLEQAMVLRIGTGDTYRFEIPSWLIERHIPSSDEDIPDYGLSQVYFAVCDGKIGVSKSWQGDVDLLNVMSDATMGFPLTCSDPDTGDERGPDNFMVSYSNVYAYEELSNKNPVISGVEFDGQAVDDSALCIGKSCALYADACDNPKAPRVPRCKKKKTSDCDTIKVLPVLSEVENSEVDVIASNAGTSGGDLLEQMWLRYYADRGEIRSEVKRLQDATVGWFEDHGTKWEIPRSAGSAKIWSVAYDNRGGVDYAQLSVCVERVDIDE